MPRAKLTLTVPEEVWLGELARLYPDATFRVLAALSDDVDAGVGLAEVVAEDTSAVLSKMAGYEDVTDIDRLQEEDGKVLIRFRTTMPLLLFPARDSGIPLEMPFEISDGEAVWEVTAPQDRLSALGEQLDQFDIGYTVDYIHQHVTEEPLLTDRQRRLVVKAVEAGYYDTPRESSLTELAVEVDIAKSTASETLHRAEEQIVKEYVTQLESE
ncbi:Transcriptional regulator, contains HTH domain [Halapricum desulfuricans]|uniref:Transcriptional regulator, contains HTH domain n=1 Tax=Halapricum desulfuricans TaxID=2841257 RepID=A0A897NJX2_9EURY|nr:helix-turn-helix domain-containing protein [Halapricum desulfuricans]QSG11253.1 Transcriptional regulator, contains HTH domain [Halapricum desulfuricans]